jgi:hypothetical protein
MGGVQVASTKRGEGENRAAVLCRSGLRQRKSSLLLSKLNNLRGRVSVHGCDVQQCISRSDKAFHELFASEHRGSLSGPRIT